MKRRKLIVTGDRILIKPDLKEERTKVGLYLPQTVKANEEAIGGFVIQTGPGIPLAEPGDISEEPWKKQSGDVKYIPVQAQEGDYAIFLQKAGIPIEYEGERYVIVPQSAILILLREEDDALLGPSPEEPEDDLDDFSAF